MTKPLVKWPLGVSVGERMVTLAAEDAQLTPAQARKVAEELLIRADLMEGKQGGDGEPGARMVEGVPRRFKGNGMRDG